MHGRHSYVYVLLILLLKCIKYSSIITNFDSKKRNKIIAPALENSLNKSAMARKFPRGVLYGPDLCERLNIKHPYYNQGIIKLMACVQECAIAPQTGSLIQTLAEDLMVKLGYSMTLGSLNWKVAIQYPTLCWYGNLAKFVSSQVLDIKGNFSQFKLLQQSHIFIMFSFIKQEI